MNYEYIIDRIEENYVIVEKENGEMDQILIDTIKGKFKEGDILVKEGLYFIVNETLTKARKDKMNDMTKDMWE